MTDPGHPDSSSLSPPSPSQPRDLSFDTSNSSRRTSRSTVSSIDGDSFDDQRASRPPSTNGHSQSQSPRESSRRTSDASTSPGTAGTFLARFLSSFSSTSSSPARPVLPRSVSSPLVAGVRNSPPSAFPPTLGTEPLSSYSFSQSSLSKRLRPSFARRATTGTSSSSSPASSPPLPAESGPSAPSTPGSERSLERNPMESATLETAPPRRGSLGSSRGSVEAGPSNMVKHGSSTSQRTLLGVPPASPPLSPLGRGRPFGQPVAAPSGPPPLENPLVLISTLLPTALLLLSFLGPGHLFSPPLVLPTLDSVFSPWDASHDADRPHRNGKSVAPDQQSISSSHTSTSSLPPLPAPVNTAPEYSHELYAPSTISVPAVSAAALWRVFRGLEWISEVGTPSDGVSKDERDKVFDFPSVLQGAADALAADAAAKGVELVVGQVGSGSAPSPIATPAATSQDTPGGGSNVFQKDTESRELLVKGDERKWSVVLIWILHAILAGVEPGSTVEVHFVATVATPPPTPAADARGSHDTILPTRQSTEMEWTVSLEILHMFPRDTTLGSDSSPPSPNFTSSFAKSLFSFADVKIGTGPSDSGSRSWILEALIPGARPALPPLDDPSSLLGRRRASLEAQGREPSMDELKAFADKGLKGTRVVLHAGEQSTFAKHLTTSLAGWGMDVAHVPLDHDDGDSASTSGGPETGWNKGRRETYGRFDSGFGGSPGGTDTNSPEPVNSPLKGVPDFPSPGSSSGGTDAPSSLIIVDDDTYTLRRLLYSLRPSPAPIAPSIIGKRPQLSARRTRSSPHVRQLHQIPPAGAAWVIIHFASLSHYKTIKEIVQDALANCRSSSLPDVLVIPKPAGPRRIITALWTALKRPSVDPSLAPIATSPTSPGIQYWTPRLSPAIANQQDFDSAAAEALAAKEPGSSGSVKPRTPPIFFGSGGAGTHPPSPLGKISDEQVSYFSCVAQNMDGTTPSEGMVIQSPDGRPAIFFQPLQGRRTSTVKEKLGSRPMERDREPHKDIAEGSATPPTRASVAAPHEIGLGQGRRTPSSSSTTISSPHDRPPSAPLDTPALTLDSFIAKSREGLPDQIVSSADAHIRQASPPVIPPRPSSRPTNTSPRGSATAHFPARQMSPPISPHVDSHSPPPPPTPAAEARRRESSAASTASPPPPHSRRTSASGGHRRRKNRKLTLPPTVPPINVLIVEDNPINQAILSMFMKKRGIKFAVAKDGEEAVQKWKAGSFHLVLMDIQLPVKDGIEATREIREMERANNIGTFITTPTSDSTSPPMSSLNSPSSPLSMPVIIVALTASSLQIDRVTALAAGCNDFLTKPVSLPWLQQKLLEWGSMAYLSGFSRSSSGTDDSRSSSFSSSKPAFSVGLNARAKADAISAHLHIDPRSSRSISPAEPVEPHRIGAQDAAPSHPAVTISSPTPVVSPKPTRPTSEVPLHAVVVDDVSTSRAPSSPDLHAIDLRLEDIKSQPQRPGPSPLSPANPTLESIFKEGERLVAVGRSRANSTATESFSQVMQHSGTVSQELLDHGLPSDE